MRRLFRSYRRTFVTIAVTYFVVAVATYFVGGLLVVLAAFGSLNGRAETVGSWLVAISVVMVSPVARLYPLRGGIGLVVAYALCAVVFAGMFTAVVWALRALLQRVRLPKN